MVLVGRIAFFPKARYVPQTVAVRSQSFHNPLVRQPVAAQNRAGL
jgi:hypothetical protein